MIENKEIFIEYLISSELIPDENNNRTHTREQIESIKSSIKEFGFTNPILVDENKEIIAGHARYEASQGLGYETVPCVTLSGLTEVQKRAYVIADNQLAINGSDWDLDKLRQEIQYLDDVGFDTDLLGFEDEAMLDLLNNVDGVDLPILADGDKEPFQQITFTLHDEQHEIIVNALTLSRTNPLVDTGMNDNSNGNAITLICNQWLEAKHANS